MHVPCTHAERSGTHLSPFCTHLPRVCTHHTFPTAALHARTHVRAACHALFTVPFFDATLSNRRNLHAYHYYFFPSEIGLAPKYELYVASIFRSVIHDLVHEDSLDDDVHWTVICPKKERMVPFMTSSMWIYRWALERVCFDVRLRRGLE